jgi:hypothetical protein
MTMSDYGNGPEVTITQCSFLVSCTFYFLLLCFLSQSTLTVFHLNTTSIPLSCCLCIQRNTIGSRVGESTGIILNRNSFVRIVESIFENTFDSYVDIQFMNSIVWNYFGRLEMQRNCFVNNTVQIAPVISQTLEQDVLALIIENNGGDHLVGSYSTSNKKNDKALKTCGFVTSYKISDKRHITDTCIDFDHGSYSSSCRRVYDEIHPTSPTDEGTTFDPPVKTASSSSTRFRSTLPKLLICCLHIIWLFVSA